MAFSGLLETRRERLLFLSITALGISHIVTQIVLLREFLSAFSGNELVFGIVLGNWVLTMGMGAWLGRHSGKIRRKLDLLMASQLAMAFLPFLSITLVRGIRAWLFMPGQALDPFQVFASSLLILMPYTLIAGFLLTLACSLFTSGSGEERIGRVYFLDNIGDILGGLLFSFLLVFFLNSFQAAAVVMAINIIPVIMLSGFMDRRILSWSLAGLLLASIAGLTVYDLNLASAGLAYPGQEILLLKNSPYGQLAVTEGGGQLNFFENGIILFSTENAMQNEEAVHFAMAQRPAPGRVLLISGGAAGTALEALKYGAAVDYVELDPEIIEIGKSYTTNLDAPGISTFVMDGRLFVRQAALGGRLYDVVIIDLPDPSTAQLNRFYTTEFFNDLKGTLAPGGVVSLSLTSSENYLGPETAALNSVVYNTLRESFGNVLAIPGDENFFLASDGELSYDIAGLIEERGIETAYVNEGYLSARLTPDRIGYLNGVLEAGPGRVNQDFLPLAYYYHMLSWLDRFGTGLLPLLAILLAFTVLALARIRPAPLALMTTGFAASGIEVVLLIGFQVIYGYVYSSVGIIITAFMAGLAAGAYWMNGRLGLKGRPCLVRIELMIAGFSVILPLAILALAGVRDQALAGMLSQAAFPGLALILAVLVGMEFPLASKLHLRTGRGEIEQTAGTLYSADLAGAFLGAVVVGALLIPLLGLFNVCMLIGGLNLISGLVAWRVG
jgi:spermidine synthase